ncbi:MAG TPA: ChrR family anti-sigma-E factor [Rhizomicrobium sp.]|nr:ChrR family anti-sigma-E factor [Rhizomicrobium sp.]
MSATHHPSDEFLLAHAGGVADEALSLIVATHLALCPACRQKVARMETAGGAMLEDLAPEALSGGALASVLSKLDGTPAERRKPASGARAHWTAPEPLRSYLGGDLGEVRWTSMSSGISYKPLFKRGKTAARLIRSRPGRGVGVHTHKGEELTLVLTGGYTDQTGHYLRGDLQAADGTLDHRPIADEGEDCIVLAVCDAPLKFRARTIGLIARFFGF